MFSVIVSADRTAWENSHRMRMNAERFGEHSDGVEFAAANISLANPGSLASLERLETLLMYEIILKEPPADVVRVGRVRDVRLEHGDVAFRFEESGRLPRESITSQVYRLQMTDWETSRTHWAVKDGRIPLEILQQVTHTPKSYDVALSFAGEDRPFVKQVARMLLGRGVGVFYDENEQVSLWGKDLVEHFDSLYRKQARFCVMFISRHYAEKVWTRFERKAALAAALVERREYVLPVRFDETEIPGLPPTVGYLDVSGRTPEEVADLILQKLGQ